MQATARSLQLHLHDDRLIPDHLLFLFPPDGEKSRPDVTAGRGAMRPYGWSRHSPDAPREEAPPGPAVPISGMWPHPFCGKRRWAGRYPRARRVHTVGVVAAERDRSVPDFPAAAVAGRRALPAAGSGGRAYCGRSLRGAARTTTTGRTRAPCTVDAAAGRRRGGVACGARFSVLSGMWSGTEQRRVAVGAERGHHALAGGPGGEIFFRHVQRRSLVAHMCRVIPLR